MSSGCYKCGIGASKNCSYCAEKDREQVRAESSAREYENDKRLRQEQQAREDRLDNEAKELRNEEATLRLEKQRWEFEQQKNTAE